MQDSSLILDNRYSLTKSKKIHHLPLNSKAFGIVNKRYEAKVNDTFVFTYNSAPILQNFISRKFRYYIKAAGLDSKLTFHSMRHSFGS